MARCPAFRDLPSTVERFGADVRAGLLHRPPIVSTMRESQAFKGGRKWCRGRQTVLADCPPIVSTMPQSPAFTGHARESGRSWWNGAGRPLHTTTNRFHHARCVCIRGLCARLRKGLLHEFALSPTHSPPIVSTLPESPVINGFAPEGGTNW